MGDADTTSEALGANPLVCLVAVCPFDPTQVMPMEFDFRPHMIDNKVKDQESGKSKDAGDQANASPGKSKDNGKESGNRKDKGDHPAASSQVQEPGKSEDKGVQPKRLPHRLNLTAFST